MALPTDVEALKLCRREFIKHRVDISRCDIHVSSGVIYVRGILKKERFSAFEDLEEETLRILRILRQRPEVRDVVVEVAYR